MDQLLQVDAERAIGSHHDVGADAVQRLRVTQWIGNRYVTRVVDHETVDLGAGGIGECAAECGGIFRRLGGRRARLHRAGKGHVGTADGRSRGRSNGVTDHGTDQCTHARIQRQRHVCDRDVALPRRHRGLIDLRDFCAARRIRSNRHRFQREVILPSRQRRWLDGHHLGAGARIRRQRHRLDRQIATPGIHAHGARRTRG